MLGVLCCDHVVSMSMMTTLEITQACFACMQVGDKQPTASPAAEHGSGCGRSLHCSHAVTLIHRAMPLNGHTARALGNTPLCRLPAPWGVLLVYAGRFPLTVTAPTKMNKWFGTAMPARRLVGSNQQLFTCCRHH